MILYTYEVRKTIDNIIELNDEALYEYRRAGMSIPQEIIKPAISKEDIIELLRQGKISEFNTIREGLEKVDLSGAYLIVANLSMAKYQ